MNVSDMDKLIDTELYANVTGLEPNWVSSNWELGNWCPLHWAVHEGNFEFVEIMIRTPFDFNTLRFDRFFLGDPNLKCSYNVLHKAANNGRIEIIKLILKFAEEKIMSLVIQLLLPQPKMILKLYSFCSSIASTMDPIWRILE